jgi:hypothetical protein
MNFRRDSMKNLAAYVNRIYLLIIKKNYCNKNFKYVFLQAIKFIQHLSNIYNYIKKN